MVREGYENVYVSVPFSQGSATGERNPERNRTSRPNGARSEAKAPCRRKRSDETGLLFELAKDSGKEAARGQRRIPLIRAAGQHEA